MTQQHSTATQAVKSKPSPVIATNGEGARSDVDRTIIKAHDELVRRAAYSLYEARGRVDGHEVEDWLNAEREVAQAESATRQPPR